MLPRLIQLLAEKEGGLSLSEISRALGAQPSAVMSMLLLLAQKGKVAEIGPDGKHCAACGLESNCNLLAMHGSRYALAINIKEEKKMKQLAEIYRSRGIKLRGKVLERQAARAIVRRGDQLLMVYSARVGDYKFPGGGLEAGESPEAALRRELREECGAELLFLKIAFGAITEYDYAEEESFDFFKMTSQYYFCQIGEELSAQSLDDYEKELGFQPVWIGAKDALAANRALLGNPQAPAWLRREILALESL